MRIDLFANSPLVLSNIADDLLSWGEELFFFFCLLECTGFGVIFRLVFRWMFREAYRPGHGFWSLN